MRLCLWFHFFIHVFKCASIFAVRHKSGWWKFGGNRRDAWECPRWQVKLINIFSLVGVFKNALVFHEQTQSSERNRSSANSTANGKKTVINQLDYSKKNWAKNKLVKSISILNSRQSTKRNVYVVKQVCIRKPSKPQFQSEAVDCLPLFSVSIWRMFTHFVYLILSLSVFCVKISSKLWVMSKVINFSEKISPAVLMVSWKNRLNASQSNGIK